MTREEMKEIVGEVIEKLDKGSPSTACGLFWADVAPTTKYAVGEADVTTYYAVGEEG